MILAQLLRTDSGNGNRFVVNLVISLLSANKWASNVYIILMGFRLFTKDFAHQGFSI